MASVFFDDAPLRANEQKLLEEERQKENERIQENLQDLENFLTEDDLNTPNLSMCSDNNDQEPGQDHPNLMQHKKHLNHEIYTSTPVGGVVPPLRSRMNEMLDNSAAHALTQLPLTNSVNLGEQQLRQQQLMYREQGELFAKCKQEWQEKEQELEKQIRMAEHKQRMAEADKDALELNLKETKAVLSESANKVQELTSELKLMRSEYQKAATVVDQYKQRLKSTELTIEQQNQQLEALSTTDTIERVRAKYEDIVESLKTRQRQELQEFQADLSARNNEINELRDQLMQYHQQATSDREMVDQLNHLLDEQRRRYAQLNMQGTVDDVTKLAREVEQLEREKRELNGKLLYIQNEMKEMQSKASEEDNRGNLSFLSILAKRESVALDTTDCSTDIVKRELEQLVESNRRKREQIHELATKNRENEEEISKLQFEIEGLKQKGSNSTTDLVQCKATLAEKIAELTHAQTELEDCKRQLNSSQAKLGDEKTKVSALQEQLETCKRQNLSDKQEINNLVADLEMERQKSKSDEIRPKPNLNFTQLNNLKSDNDALEIDMNRLKDELEEQVRNGAFQEEKINSLNAQLVSNREKQSADQQLIKQLTTNLEEQRSQNSRLLERKGSPARKENDVEYERIKAENDELKLRIKIVECDSVKLRKSALETCQTFHAQVFDFVRSMEKRAEQKIRESIQEECRRLLASVREKCDLVLRLKFARHRSLDDIVMVLDKVFTVFEEKAKLKCKLSSEASAVVFDKTLTDD